VESSSLGSVFDGKNRLGVVGDGHGLPPKTSGGIEEKDGLRKGSEIVEPLNSEDDGN
jgi:hypothetical protein